MLETITATANAYPLDGLPMRPTMGDRLTPRNVLRIVRELEPDFLIQPKLNGDRVLLHKTASTITAWNRHGSRYSFNVNAAADWHGLPDDTLLDGEGWQGRFWPFEAVEIAGASLSAECVTVRATAAKDLCRTLGQAYLFYRPADAWLVLCRENLPAWEGIVAKRTGKPYTPITRPSHKSRQWLKVKW